MMFLSTTTADQLKQPDMPKELLFLIIAKPLTNSSCYDTAKSVTLPGVMRDLAAGIRGFTSTVLEQTSRTPQ
ncbi:Acyltransferase AFT15-1 [Fusarium oxysporum f. sp. albedinis]|nr:Acyltransferase AFT15-1 [Fusarium oxysporum f. sp. albedinis]